MNLQERTLKVYGKVYKVKYSLDGGIVTLQELYEQNKDMWYRVDFNKIMRDRLIYHKVCSKEGIKVT